MNNLRKLCLYYIDVSYILSYSLIFLLLWQPVRGQATYYVANTGNDANDGRSANSPFQSLTKVNSLSLRAGDMILFRRGDTFRGTLSIRQSGSSGSPIVLDAYSSGDKPIIAGSVPVSNWNNIGNNTWQASCSTCGSQVTGVYRNGAVLPLGRYPNLSDSNKGYLTVQSHNGQTQLTSQQGLGTNWTGGEVVVRPNQWILDRAPITQQNGNTLTINNNSGYSLADGWGFFIQNHPATLDQSGEWYYNPADKTIRLYDSQNNPNGQIITVTVSNEGVNLTNASFVTVRNLHITQTLTVGLAANGGSNLTFSGNDITRSGLDGVYINGSGNTVLAENNLIEDANGNGFTIEPYQNFTFRNNTIRRVGLAPGRGKSGDGGYTGLQVLCTANTLIENNTIDNIGYSGITVVTNSAVRNNQISNFCQTKSDGGGLYMWNGNRNNVGGLYFQSNTIYNGIGAAEGTPGGSYSGANGIYLDDCSQNVEVTNNTTFGSRGLGIFLHGASNITVKGNTSYNNSEGQIKLTYSNNCTARNNVIQNNILFSRLPNQLAGDYESNANDLNQYGSFDANYYARPFEDQFKIRAVYNPGSGMIGADNTLAEWQAQWGQDRNSFNSSITYPTQNVSQTGASLLNQSFSANTNGWGVWSPYGNGRADWDNPGRLDGGSLRLSFASSSGHSDAYLLATIGIGTITRGKTYQLLFDGTASATGKRVQVFPRQASGSYSDLASRAMFALTANRQAYQAFFTATADESNAILVLQVPEDGRTAWFDNIRLQEVTATPANPDDYIKFVYNPTAQDKTQSLDAVYKDVKGNEYSNQVTVSPFSSSILLKVVNSTPASTPTSLRDPENPANAIAGLDYSYYEGSWNSLPDFNALTPVKTGTVATANLSVRNRDDQFGLRYKGYVNVPTDGVYTFYTSSDDGSKLLIGTTEVVNNDGGHATQERSGTIGLKAGKHALTIPYYEGGGDQTLTVSYEGPGIGKQTIPASAFFRVSSGTAGGTGTGLRAEYFNNTNLTTPVAMSRTDATVNFDWGTSAPGSGVNADNFSVRWTGQVEAPVTGNYTFSTNTDDGVRLWVNGTQLINDWNGHPPTTNNGSSIALTAGQKYDIRMEYFDGGGGAVAKLLWAYPNQSQQVIPQERLYPATGSGRLAASQLDSYDTQSEFKLVYPIPTFDAFTFVADSDVQLFRVIDLLGRERLQSANIRRGESLSFGSQLPAGHYLLYVEYTDGKHRTEKLLKVDH